MKQTTLASFFGKPIAATQPTDRATAATAGRKASAGGGRPKSGDAAAPSPEVLKEANARPEEKAGVPLSNGSAQQAEGGAKPTTLKRLRKASDSDAPGGAKAAALASAEAASAGVPASPAEEDDEAVAQAPASKAKRSTKRRRVLDADSDASPELKAKARARSSGKDKREEEERTAAAPADAAAAPSSPAASAGAGASSSSSSDAEPLSEEEQEVVEKKQKKKPVGKAAKAAKGGTNVAKMDGVGALMHAAAEQHSKFDLQALATWQPGKPVPFSFLAATFEAIGEESKRLVITNILVNAFRAVILTTPADLLPLVYLCTDKVAPAHEGLELGIGDATLVKALAAATGRKDASIKKQYEETGDLGVVAALSRSSQKLMFQPQPLTVAGVFRTFKEIAQCEGKSSQERKKQLISKLLVASKDDESGYIIRALQGKLRIGLAEQTVLTALGHAAALAKGAGDESTAAAAMTATSADAVPPPSSSASSPAGAAASAQQEGDEEEGAAVAAAAAAAAGWGSLKPDRGGGASGKAGGAQAPLSHRLEAAAQAVKQAYSECPSFDDLVPAVLEHSIEELPKHVHFRPGIPVRPMLAKPTTGVSEVLDKFQGLKFTCEYKYDGERAQVHVLEDGSVKIYSRNAENNTTKYPDIAAIIPKILKPGTSSIVFDAEAVAYDRESDRILPFQVLSTRARKDVSLADVKVQVCLFAFDCLYLNGNAMLKAPLTERREALYGALQERDAEFKFATYKTSTDVEELAAFLDESVAACTEGLIVKTMDATYEPSRRSVNWLKLKKDYLAGVGDTFDVVPIGAWFGKGKRTGGYGAFLLAVYNPDADEYQTISKIGTGFSEEQLKTLSEDLQKLAIDKPRPYYRYGETLIPDVWFDTKVVWEVKAADLSISPVHQAAAGLVDSAKGISIRFPRLVRVREDKGPEDATTAEQVADMYRGQAAAQNNKKPTAGDDDS